MRMAAPTSRCLILLTLGSLVAVSLARPQQSTQDDAVETNVPVKAGRLTNEEAAFFAPGSWQPVGDSGLVIDQAPSRVRIEKNASPRDARSGDETLPPSVPTAATTTTTTTTTVVSSNATANATSTRGKSPSPLGDAIKMVASQLLQSRGAIDEADVRSPPKTTAQAQKKKDAVVSQATSSEESSHSGVAIPVILDDEMERISSSSNKETTTKKTMTTLKKTSVTEMDKKTTVTRRPQGTTNKKPIGMSSRNPVTSTPDKITTWVYLSGSSPSTSPPTASTETPLTTVSKTPTEVSTKKQKLTTVVLEKSNRKPSPLFTSSGTKPFPNRNTKKPVEEEQVKDVTGNKKESASVSVEEVKEKAAKKPEQDVVFRRRPTISPIETSTYYKAMPTAYPIGTTKAPEVETTTEGNTEVNTETTSKRPKDKKKKNKRRRRPSKKPAAEANAIESKIDTDVKETKMKPKPMGTRIYNYLAREVMPSVGVGLIGLVGLAGLAGLILYPFGGGTLPIRRNYEPPSNYYYYNKEKNNNNNNNGGQTEEEVLGKVLAGMKDPSYVTGEQYPDAGSRNPSQEKYTRFDMDTGAGQQGNGEYTRYSTGQEGKEGDSYLRYDIDQGNKKDEKYNSYNVENKDTDYTGYNVASRINIQSDKTPVADYDTDIVTSDAQSSQQQYSSRTEPRPVYLSNDWGVVKTDVQEAETANKPQALMYRAEDEPIYGQSVQPDERTRYETSGQSAPQYSGVSRVGVGQRRNVAVEHGPRRLRRDLVRDLRENEIDMEVKDDEEVTESREEVTERREEVTDKMEDEKTTDKVMSTMREVDISTNIPEVTKIIVKSGDTSTSTSTSTTTNMNKDSNNHTDAPSTTFKPEEITIEAEDPEDPSLIGLIRRVAQFKIRLGISFLKNTSQAFSRYLDGMQKRVESIHNTMSIQKRTPIY